MTTIAWDGEILAVDRLASIDSSIFGFICKLHDIRRHPQDEPLYAAVAGDLPESPAFMNWYKDRTTKEPPSVGRYFQALVVGVREGKLFCEYWDTTFYAAEIGQKIAIGSGWFWATAAMDFGRDAKTAVEYAATRDGFTGGGVDSVRIIKE